MKSNPDDMTAAILIWLPDGLKASAEDFDEVRDDKKSSPPSLALSSFGKAVAQVNEILERGESHGRLPWIKVGSEVFGPDQIRTAFSTVREIKGRSSGL